MESAKPMLRRCAIYTRKSSEEGLERAKRLSLVLPRMKARISSSSKPPIPMMPPARSLKSFATAFLVASASILFVTCRCSAR